MSAIACSKHNSGKYEADNIIHVRTDAESTKSTIMTSEGIKTTPGKFIMEAYVDKDVFNDEGGQHAHTRVGNPYFGPTTKLPENVAYDGTNKKWNLTRLDNKDIPQPCYWVSSDGNMSFWSWLKSRNGLNEINIKKDDSAPYLTSPNVDKTKGVKMVFDYSLPTPTLETDPEATSLDDATNQEDLVFSYWQAALTNYTPDADEPTYPEREDVWVHFYHALSQIRFCFSNNDDSIDEGIQIKSIAIGDIASGGTCTFWGKTAMDEFVRLDKRESDSGRKVEEIFSWDDLKADKTYRQDYNVSINSSTEEYTGWTTGTYTKDSETFRLFTCKNVFMMIPQALSSKACVRLTIVDSTKPEGKQEQEFVSFLKPLNERWESGKYYTYKLNYKNDQISFKLTLEKWGVIEGDQAREFNVD